MRKDTERAYWAWRRAADRGYGKSASVHYTTIVRVDRRIAGLKARYEAMLARDKAAGRLAT